MWDGTMLMMTSMGLFLSLEGIRNSVRGGCGLDRQMIIWRRFVTLPSLSNSATLTTTLFFLISQI